MTRYSVTFDIDVEPEESGHFQPGSRDAYIVGTNIHAVGASDLEAVHLLLQLAFLGMYPAPMWGVEAPAYTTPHGSLSHPPCSVARVIKLAEGSLTTPEPKSSALRCRSCGNSGIAAWTGDYCVCHYGRLRAAHDAGHQPTTEYRCPACGGPVERRADDDLYRCAAACSGPEVAWRMWPSEETAKAAGVTRSTPADAAPAERDGSGI